MAHAPYVAQWLFKSGALRLFDDKPLLLTNFLFIYLFLFALHLYFSMENRTSEGDFRRKLLQYFCIIRSDCTHCTPFFDKKKCAKMSVFLYENHKNPLAAGGFHPQTPGCGPSLPNPGCTTVWGREVKTLFLLFINTARPCFKGLKKNGCFMWRI